MRRNVLALGLAWAIPASLVTNESFQPIDERVRLEGQSAERRFNVATGEPLYLEYGLILRGAGGTRPAIAIDLNGRRATTIAADRLYATVGGKVLLPPELVQRGPNVLRASIEGSTSASYELGARVQNYFGIAPDFPRLFVVADESVTHANRLRSPARHAVRFLMFLLAGVAITVGLVRLTGARRFGIGRLLYIASPAMLPWVVLLYGLTTPRHVWLSVEALVVAAFAGWMIALAVRWSGQRRVAVLQVAAVSIATLTFCEMALRLYHRVSPSFIFYSDPAGRYRGQPGATHYGSRLNSRGFNDIDHATDRPAHVRQRIVALGDSFAMGSVPYPSNYLTLLERELAGDGSVEVVNMGVSGTDPVDYLSMLVQEGLAFEPDLVLVNFFVGNDFESRERKLYEYSYVATLINALWQVSTSRPPGAATPDSQQAEYRDDEPTVTMNRFLEIEVDRSWIYVSGSDRLPSAASQVGEHLRAIRDAARRAGAQVVVVIIPDEAQVDAGLQDEVIRASGHARGDMDFELPNRVIAAELTNDGIAMLDLLPIFMDEGRKARLYKPQDTHWNIAGNRLAAVQIASFLRNRTERANMKN